MSAGAAAEYLRESGWDDALHTSPSDGRSFVDELGARPPAELRCAQGDALAPLVELRCFAATLSADLRHWLLAVAVDGFDILLANLCPYRYSSSACSVLRRAELRAFVQSVDLTQHSLFGEARQCAYELVVRCVGTSDADREIAHLVNGVWGTSLERVCRSAPHAAGTLLRALSSREISKRCAQLESSA